MSKHFAGPPPQHSYPRQAWVATENMSLSKQAGVIGCQELTDNYTTRLRNQDKILTDTVKSYEGRDAETYTIVTGENTVLLKQVEKVKELLATGAEELEKEK